MAATVDNDARAIQLAKMDELRSPLLQLRMRVADWRGRGVYAGYPDAHRCIFIHVPKTAGTSVVKCLFGRASRHVPYFVYERANPTKFRRYFKFAFVRNPWDRLVSSFFYLRQGGAGGADKAWSEENLQRYPDFRSFVLGWINSDSVSTWPHFMPQSYYILDRDERIMVDFVGHYESLVEDFQFIKNRLGLDVTLQLTNKSAHRQYASYYDAETSSIVGRVYASDIKAFGYSGQGPAR